MREHSEESDRDAGHRSAFASRLWYGGGFSLGFSGYQGGNVFSVGVAPQVGYKIVERFSMGPRLSYLFTSVKVPGFKAVGLNDVDAGIFARFRIFQGLFIQGELSNEWYQEPILYTNGTIEKDPRERFNQRLGLGWNFGNGQGGGGSEVGIFYNFAVASELETYQNPLEYRFGFTWRF